MKLNALYKATFGESETVPERWVTMVAMVTVAFQNGSQFVFNVI